MCNSKAKSEQVLLSLPGVSYAVASTSDSSNTPNSSEFSIAVQFHNDLRGTADRLLVLFCANRVAAKIIEPTGPSGSQSINLTCNEERISNFCRAIEYASDTGMSDQPPASTLSSVALPILLTRALTAFTEDYSNKTESVLLPSLAVWSNVLRVLNDRGIDQKQVEVKAVISTRTRKVVLRNCSVLRWVEFERKQEPKRKVLVRLTNAGEQARRNGLARIAKIENQWSAEYGRVFEKLRSALRPIVQDLDLEYPYYVTGYGPADDALTGGPYVPAIEGPPRIPARGTEWPVVLRRASDDIFEMPLPALLSQCLAAFAIEYEMEKLGRLGHVLTLFRYIGDDGVELGSVRERGGISGGGRSLHERHMNVVLEPGKPSNNARKVYLTPKSRRARDSYSFLVQDLEQRWQRHYGTEPLKELRTTLEELVQSRGIEGPDYPNTTSWMSPYFIPYSI